jgi:hypothetical protein
MTRDQAESGHTGSRRRYYLAMRSFLLAMVLVVSPLTAQQADPARPAIGQTVTTASGLTYKFTQLGKGPKPATGDLMVIHGIGTFPDGKEFWNTRTDGAPYEYTLGVDRVIRGFEEGMQAVREGDRIVITMKPELAYGEKGSRDIPPNSTLVFDYEILGVKPKSFARLMREALAAGTTDEAIAAVKATPDLTSYYVSAPGVQSAANAANRKQAGDNEKVLAFGLTLLPNAYQLHQALGRAQAQRKAIAEAVKSYEIAIKLNPGRTPPEIRDRETAVKALDDLKKGGDNVGPV